jgi:hypothetical protein
MYAVQISDRATFANKAKEIGVPVVVVRTATVIPVQQGNAVLMHPAVAIDYAIEFEDRTMGQTRWTFREVVLTGERGEALISDSLLRMLIEDSIPVRIIQRSGSF